MDPSFAAARDGDRPLPVAGFKGTPEEIERQWYEQVYTRPRRQHARN